MVSTIPSHPRTPAELNIWAADYYAQEAVRISALLERRSVKRYIKQAIVEPYRNNELPKYSFEEFRKLSSFEEVITLEFEAVRGRNERNAQQPRRKAAGRGESLRELIQEFATRPKNATSPTKQLWPRFLAFLQSKELNLLQLDDRTIEYRGRNQRIQLRERQFQKIVSEVAPRRQARKSR